MAHGIIYAGTTSAVIEWDGVRRPIGPDTTVREGHPILAAHPELFAPLVPDFETAEPAKDNAPPDGGDGRDSKSASQPPAATGLGASAASRRGGKAS